MFKQRINIDRPPEYLTDDDEQMRLPGCAHIVIIRQLESKDALRIVANDVGSSTTFDLRRVGEMRRFLLYSLSLSPFCFIFSSLFSFFFFLPVSLFGRRGSTELKKNHLPVNK